MALRCAAALRLLTPRLTPRLPQLLAAAAAPAELANAAGRGGNAALHMAAANGHASICELLLQAGAHVNAKNEAGNTPLHWAALNGHLAAVNMLLAKDASPFEMNGQMRIALDEATAGDHTEVVTAIRLAGEAKVAANQEEREKVRAETVAASTGSTQAEAAAEAKQAADEAMDLVDTPMEGSAEPAPEPEPEPAQDVNGYGTVAVDLAKEQETLKALRKAQMDRPPPTAMKCDHPPTGPSASAAREG